MFGFCWILNAEIKASRLHFAWNRLVHFNDCPVFAHNQQLTALEFLQHYICYWSACLLFILLTENSSQSSSSSTLSRSNSTASVSSQGSQKETESGQGDSQSTPPQEEPSTPTSPEPKQTCFPMRASKTRDTVRLKCRELLTNALRVDGEEKWLNKKLYCWKTSPKFGLLI